MAEQTQTRALTPFQQAYTTIRSYIRKDINNIQGLIPKESGLTAEQLIVAFLNSMRKNTKLADCQPETIAAALKHCAVFAQMPDTALQHCHIIPYSAVATFVAGYRGIIDMLIRSGVCRGVSCGVAWKDEIESGGFRFIESSESKIGLDFHHDLMRARLIDREDPNSFDFVYAVLWPKDTNGVPGYVLLNRAEINRIRATSKAYQQAVKYNRQDSVWHLWYDRQAIKTAIKQASKVMRLTSDIARLIEIDEKGEMGESQALAEEMVDAEFTVETAPTEEGGGTTTEKVGASLKSAADKANGKNKTDMLDKE